MQTFITRISAAGTPRDLDRQRLGKQRVEALQILHCLLNPSPTRAWQSHPAVKMWRGHEQRLAAYTLAICAEWTRRGYADTVAQKILALTPVSESFAPPPWWITNPDVVRSHQSNLIRKVPEHYAPKFPGVDGSQPYLWPDPHVEGLLHLSRSEAQRLADRGRILPSHLTYSPQTLEVQRAC